MKTSTSHYFEGSIFFVKKYYVINLYSCWYFWRRTYEREMIYSSYEVLTWTIWSLNFLSLAKIVSTKLWNCLSKFLEEKPLIFTLKSLSVSWDCLKWSTSLSYPFFSLQRKNKKPIIITQSIATKIYVKFSIVKLFELKKGY